MGLPIAKEIAEAHGGAAGVYSHVGKGSEFFLVIQEGTSSPAADGHPIPVPSGNLAI
jgi:signal transduction histidine kinase